MATVLAVVGLSLGVSAAGLAFLRERRRKAFVRRVGAGEVPGFRIHETTEGNVLVRVTSRGEGYRVVDFEEPLAKLDVGREVTRSVA